MLSDKDEVSVIILMIFGAIAILFIEAFLGLWIWNLVMPTVFGLPVLTFWQFWGICFLGRMIFPHTIVRKN